MREKNQFELGSAACARETFGAMEINLVGEGRQSGKTGKGERREPSPAQGGSQGQVWDVLAPLGGSQ